MYVFPFLDIPLELFMYQSNCTPQIDFAIREAHTVSISSITSTRTPWAAPAGSYLHSRKALGTTAALIALLGVNYLFGSLILSGQKGGYKQAKWNERR